MSVNVVNYSAYYRKMNGTSTPIAGRGGVEMSSLLSGQTRMGMNSHDGGVYDESMNTPFHVLEINPNSIVGEVFYILYYCNLTIDYRSVYNLSLL